MILLAMSLFAAAASPSAEPAPACAPAVAFTGTVCTPSSSGKHPAILVLGGSEGGDSPRAAAKFSSYGYVAASVAYFGAPGLPDTLQQIPVETVGKALAAIEKRDDVDAGRIAIFGISKGGEFALLAAATYPHIHAVIADVPSPFAWEGIPAGASSVHESSWTVDGKPLPFLPFTAAIGQAFGAAFTTHTPLDLRPAYDASMNDSAAVTAAFFHLEKINGPVLFLSAGDDRIWNSPEHARMGLAYLKKMHHGFADEVKEYPLAGHLFVFATTARPFVDTPFIGGLTLRLGGTAQANVDAAADAWPRMSSFLGSSLHSRSSSR